MLARRLAVVPLVALLVFASACASSAGGGGGGGGSATVMTEANLASNATSAGESLFDTLSRVRPQWVENRQGTVMVFIDGVNAGSAAQTLRTITVGSVREVRYIRPESASSRFGSGFEGGVIEVTLKQ